MNGTDYQTLAKRTAHYDPAVALHYLTLGLAGEAGEVANKVKKVYRDGGGTLTPERTAAIADELGDVLWYVAMLCTELGLSLDDVMQANVDKLASRDARGAIGGDGDTR